MFIKSTIEHVARAVLVAWLGWWMSLSGHDLSDLVSHQAVLMAVTAGVGALLLCLGASQVGSKTDASFIKPVVQSLPTTTTNTGTVNLTNEPN